MKAKSGFPRQEHHAAKRLRGGALETTRPSYPRALRHRFRMLAAHAPPCPRRERLPLPFPPLSTAMLASRAAMSNPATAMPDPVHFYAPLWVPSVEAPKSPSYVQPCPLTSPTLSTAIRAAMPTNCVMPRSRPPLFSNKALWSNGILA